MTFHRIHITGGQGSGKTTLAARLGDLTGIAVHELDQVARVGGGNGPERPVAERDALIGSIAATDDWITEGVHLGWTAALLDRADAIVWLDHVSPTEASGRMVRRFLSGAVHEFRTRRGRERYLRVRDYLRHARHLGGALRHAHGANEPAGFANGLAPWSDRLVHCTSDRDMESFLATVAASLVGGDDGSPERAPGSAAVRAA